MQRRLQFRVKNTRGFQSTDAGCIRHVKRKISILINRLEIVSHVEDQMPRANEEMT